MNQRGVSSTLSYVLALGIAAILITGLLIAAGGFVSTQRDVVLREEMDVVGQHVASNVEQADRLVNASKGSDTVVYVNQTFPSTVARSTYDVRLNASAEQVVLTSTEPEHTVRINVSTNTELQDSSADGGAITVRYDEGDDALVIDNV